MPQFLRPAEDVITTSWVPTPSSPTTLYDKIDEAVADDADYVQGGGASATVKFSSGTDPLSSTGHVLRVRGLGNSSYGYSWTAALYQGATLIKSNTYSNTTIATQAYTLTAAEADSITDYADLRLQFSSPPGARIYWAELEVPDAVPPPAAVPSFTRFEPLPNHARIDWTHPLSRGLVFAYVAHGNNSYAAVPTRQLDRVSGQFSQVSGNSANTLRDGIPCMESGANTVSLWTLPAFSASADFSVVCRYVCDLGTGNPRVVSTRGGTSDFSGWIVSPTATQHRFLIGNGTALAGASGGTMTAGEWITLGGVYRSSGANVQLYLDGEFVAQTSQTYVAPGSNLITLMGDWDGVAATANRLDGAVEYAYVFSRALGKREMAMLARAPYDLFKWEGK